MCDSEEKGFLGRQMLLWPHYLSFATILAMYAPVMSTVTSDTP